MTSKTTDKTITNNSAGSFKIGNKTFSFTTEEKITSLLLIVLLILIYCFKLILFENF
jgi:hypothetical protein